MSYGPRKKHTILLVQPGTSPATRTYYDFETVFQAMSGICKLFEDKWKLSHPGRNNLVYNVNDLYDYIDQLSDMGALVQDLNTGSYRPYGKDWIKQRILKHLKKIARSN
eukprot:TRINITY_DN873_c0_g1_i2.p1 TRINITY_DN873_c0_g1~~TRINITY_DN873_c0_g1_i2.p1  ORF type:complete len:121 (-),score=19.06 TRINITY_DN873_c0_g1_i2:33-359(-)